MNDANYVRHGDITGPRAMEGSASKEGKPLALVEVQLLAEGKVIRSTTTDKDGDFVLTNLPLGHFRLSFQGLGVFEVEVVPPRMQGAAHYGFGSTRGCLDWGSDTN